MRGSNKLAGTFMLLGAACSGTAKPPADAKSTTPAASVPTPPANGIAAIFACDDSLNIYAIFNTDSAGKSEVALAINDDRFHLPQLPSASGARYGDSTMTFWNKGDSATFERGGKNRKCGTVKTPS